MAQSRSWYHAPSFLYLNLPRRRRWLNISPPCMYSRTMYRLLLSWNHTGQNRNIWQNFYQHLITSKWQIYKSDPVRNTLRLTCFIWVQSIWCQKLRLFQHFHLTALGEKFGILDLTSQSKSHFIRLWHYSTRKYVRRLPNDWCLLILFSLSLFWLGSRL